MSETTSLEDIETKRRTAIFSSYRGFLDEKSPGPAAAAVEFYEQVDGTDTGKFSNRLADCRTRAWFVRHKETGKVRIAAKQCRLRWCYHCSEARQQFITQAVAPWFNEAVRPKLLTMTIKHSKKPLPEQIDFLYKSFAKFRNRLFLKNRIRGGVWFFQITYNQEKQEWHPHLHALLDAEYLDHAELKKIWHKVTKCSNVVHIRAVHDPDHTLAHNARYAARPSALIKIPTELWPTLFTAFNGRRICGTWGNARCISLRPQKPENAEDWKSIGGFKTVARQLGTDCIADAIWSAWKYGNKIDETVTMQEEENFMDGIEVDIRPPPKWVTQPKFWSSKKFEA